MLLRELLERAGYAVDAADSARRPPRLFANVPSLVILDVTMPELDGWRTLERIRDLSDVPVLMLTARARSCKRCAGLTAGADDYVAKPFGRQELLARVQALLRRPAARPRSSRRTPTTSCDRLRAADASPSRAVTVSLTPLEFRLLSAFVQNPNQVLSRDQLLELVWGDPYGVSGDQVKLYVGYLRRKLEPDAPETRRSRRSAASATATARALIRSAWRAAPRSPRAGGRRGTASASSRRRRPRARGSTSSACTRAESMRIGVSLEIAGRRGTPRRTP